MRRLTKQEPLAYTVGPRTGVEIPVQLVQRPPTTDLGRAGQFLTNRPLDDKAFYSTCYAPHTSLYFNQHGDVRACCQNITGVLGNVRLSSIREIWDGAQSERLRRSLEQDDLSRGCAHCAWQDSEGASDERFSRGYDALAVTGRHPRWPVQMEFSMSNSCNLQCVMCTGWNSSAIRAHRDRLPPIPPAYGDDFFDELESFLPHLEKVIVLGGEPFVAQESLRLLSMLADLEHPPRVQVITNGTQWSPRVSDLFDRLPMHIDLSLDGITKDTFEAVRVGADFDTVMTNLDRYMAHADRRGTSVGLTFCLMRNNWQDFADLLQFAERRGLSHVSVNTVTDPRQHSLYGLSENELRRVVSAMETHDGPKAANLTRMKPVWDHQLEALRQRVRSFDSGPVAIRHSVDWLGGRAPEWQSCRAELIEWSGGQEPLVVWTDESQSVVKIDGPVEQLTGAPASDLLGRPVTSLLEPMARGRGGVFSPSAAHSSRHNEFAFVGIERGQVVADLRLFWFHESGAYIMLMATRTSVP